MSGEIDSGIMKYVPKSKRDGIAQAWRDSDGYWIMLKDGWNADGMDIDCQTIHEDTIKDLRYQIGFIRKVG